MFGSLATLGLSRKTYPILRQQFAASSSSETTSSGIGFIRDSVPAVELPHVKGVFYEDHVPNTLDLAERAKFALQSLTGLTDPVVNYDVFFLAIFYRNPPVLQHSSSDPFVQPKFQESLQLMRVITGSEVNNLVDEAWTVGMLRSIGPDGLYYIATRGRPWIRLGIEAWTPNVILRDGTIAPATKAPLDQITNQTVSGRIIGVMTLHYIRDGNPVWPSIIEGTIKRWIALAIDKGDYCYYPVALLTPGAQVDPDTSVPTGILAAEMGHRLIQGLAQYYRVSGYDPAANLARQLTHYVRYHSAFYDRNGRFIDVNPDIPRGHFHSHTFGLLGMLEYAIAVDDKDTLTFVQNSFEWARDHSGGNPLTGWYPEIIQPGYRYCEGCCMADMIAIALKLSVQGVGDYWDDVDRWVRNQFSEAQLLHTDWIDQMSRDLPLTPVSSNETAWLVNERSLGGFAGATSGNSWGDPHYGNAIVGCCNGNCTRTLYYVWEHVLEYKDGSLRVNLLLNRASPWADVYSYVPAVGRVDVRVKQTLAQLILRVPRSLHSHKDVVCTVNGVTRTLNWKANSVEIGPLYASELVSVRFPIEGRTVQAEIGSAKYNLILEGDTVVQVTPPGEYGPLYRDPTRGYDSVNQLKKVTRFISETAVLW